MRNDIFNQDEVEFQPAEQAVDLSEDEDMIPANNRRRRRIDSGNNDDVP